MVDMADELTKQQLLDRATELNIVGRASMTKAELADAIEVYEENPQAGESYEQIEAEANEDPVVPGVPAEVLLAAREEAEQRREALQQAVDAGWTVVNTSGTDDKFVLHLEKDGEERQAHLDADGELRYSK